MKHISKILTGACLSSLLWVNTGCIEETFPTSGATQDQLGASAQATEALMWAMPAFFNNWATISSSYHYDWGYGSIMHIRDVMTEDMAVVYSNSGYDWYESWETNKYQGQDYVYAQFIWNYYYQFIQTSNNLIGAVDETSATEQQLGYLGAALAFRALAYLDLAQMIEFLPNDGTNGVNEAGNDVVVYGLVAGWGGPSKEFASLGIQEGDVITIVGVRDEYNGTIQVGDAFFVSKESGSVEEPAGNVEVLSFSELYPEIDGEAFNLENGETYTWGGLTVTSVSVGNTSNRIWAADHSLRVYGGGSITFNAGDKVITKMEFDTKKGHFAEASVGTLTEDVWTGEASEVTFTAEEQVQVLSITVTYKD